ncbi:hypothetical protein RvY_01965 [Ramazzottius varieornatus]|uniref:Uncharacterized protein n=1 Tax=Ramazzottius varieornatus TaxID=947166 RepID=A0A1D1UI57_RAMVA|nr:hypothetical protein RvY_01965 [Ramazzottius varieornatus]
MLFLFTPTPSWDLLSIAYFLCVVQSTTAWPGNYGGTAMSNGGLASMSAMGGGMGMGMGNGMAGAMSSAMTGGLNGGMNSFANDLAVPSEFGGSMFGSGGMNPAASTNFQNGFPTNPYRSAAANIGSICYCDVRVNKMGTPGDLLFKLHYPTINAETCQMAIQQCMLSCKNQAQRQLTGNVLFEEGGLENLAPDKEVTVGTVLCKEHNKQIAPPGVIASVFAKPDACGRASPVYDLTGEESRLCCTMIAHPYVLKEQILVFSPECIAGVAPAAAPGTAAATPAGSPAPAPGGAPAAVPAQAPEPAPMASAFNPSIQSMPQFRQFDPMNAMMLGAFG